MTEVEVILTLGCSTCLLVIGGKVSSGTYYFLIWQERRFQHNNFSKRFDGWRNCIYLLTLTSGAVRRMSDNHTSLSLHPLSQSLFALGEYLPTLSTLSQRIAFYRISLFSLVLATLCNALDTGYLTTRPELAFSLVRKYPPQSQVMVEDHLDQ